MAPFHERLLLAKAHGTHWAIATPDLDIYVEDIMDLINLDETFAAIAADGTLPRLVAGRNTYTFGDFNDFIGAAGGRLVQEGLDAAPLQRLVLEPNRAQHDDTMDALSSALKASLEAGAWPLGLGDNFVPAAGAPPAGSVPVVLPLAGAGAALPAGVALGPDALVVVGHKWVVAESRAVGLVPAIGTEVTLKATAIRLGECAIDTAADGSAFFAGLGL